MSFLKRKNIPQYLAMVNKISQEIELSSVNTWTGSNNFTGGLFKNGDIVPSVASDNTWTGSNDFVGALQKSGVDVATVLTALLRAGAAQSSSADTDFTGALTKSGSVVTTVLTALLRAGAAQSSSADTNFTGALQKSGVNVATVLTAALLAGANVFTNTNNFTGGLTKGGVNVPTDATAALLAGANVYTNTNNFTGGLSKNGDAVPSVATNNTWSGTNSFNSAVTAPSFNATASSNQFVAGASNKATLNLPQGASSAYTVNAPDPTASTNTVDLMYVNGQAQTIVKNVTMNTGASLTHSGNLRFDNVSGFLTQISVDSASAANNYLLPGDNKSHYIVTSSTGFVVDPVADSKVVHNTGDETVAGIKTYSTSVKYANAAGGTVSAYDHYSNDTQTGTSVTFSGPYTTGQTPNYNISRSGNQVIMRIAAYNQTGDGGANKNITTTAIPTAYRPSAARGGMCPVRNFSIDTVGAYSVASTGIITFTRLNATGLNLYDTFESNNTKNCGMPETTLHWLI